MFKAIHSYRENGGCIRTDHDRAAYESLLHDTIAQERESQAKEGEPPKREHTVRAGFEKLLRRTR